MKSGGLSAGNTNSSTPDRDDVSDRIRPAGLSIPLVEFAVNFENQEGLRRVDEALSRKGVKVVASDLIEKTIQIELETPADDGQHSGARDVQSLQMYIEKETGFLAVIKGIGQLASAVVEMQAPPRRPRGESFGVVRMSQVNSDVCLVDGLIDGSQLQLNFQRQKGAEHRLRLAVHEFGDLSSETYDSIGDATVDILNEKLDDVGNPSEISVHKMVSSCRVPEIIGKSVALSLMTRAADVSAKCDEFQKEQEILSAGLIARASTIQANKKQVCSCSGKTLWRERQERSAKTTGVDYPI